ncbi:MAG: hypothetical protein Q7K48_00715 [Fusobacterium sp. JB021]|nr:hypothetical protein [Fusobacterium sp. JB020]MDP0492827.1 hypothetical protein [Fusobacterium sp. JB021]MDP0506949.1 hypothetical protein [Fusobacterium sp. JB019]
MYITDLEIEKYLRGSKHEYFQKEKHIGRIVDTKLKIATGKVVKEDLKSVKIFMSKLSKKLFKDKFKTDHVSEIEVIKEAEHLLHNKYKEIIDEGELLRLIEEDLIEKFL